MNNSTAWMALLLLAATAPFQAAAQTAPPRDVPFAGTLKIDVDATDLPHRIFRVRTTIPATPGPMTLLYPQWIPGNHSPTGPLDKLAGLIIKANGKVLPWTRDQFDVYAFKIEVPAGVNEIVAEYQFLSSQGNGQGQVMMTPEMLNLEWNTTMLYPAGVYVRNIMTQASVTLPAGWSYATALDTAPRSGDRVTFKPITLEDLADSPMFAGKYYKRIVLDAKSKAPVALNVFADKPEALDVKPDGIKAHQVLVQQMDKLYGARHFDHYEFLLALSEKLGRVGLEHHRSSENREPLDYFTDWNQSWQVRDLLPHEFNHSWNGKYRRGVDIATPNFNVPMGDSLLWMYEGQTQFWGQVIAARSGLWTQTQARDVLANVAASYQRGHPGLTWRALQDTTNDPTISLRRPRAYDSYQLSEDYYSGGQMMWLEVDAKLRELSGDKRSLDDFAKAFFGMHDGAWDVNTYTFDDIVVALNGIAKYDWASFLRSHLDGHGSLVGGIEASGWKLVYTEKPNEASTNTESRGKSLNLTYSLGLYLDERGEVDDVLWDSPAFAAGIMAGNRIVAVAGREYSAEALKQAITAAKGGGAPLELLVKRGDRYDTLRLDYHGGLLYPHLERIAGKPDRLSELYKTR
ncbi:M61 family metallopeptidase [Xanthomonas albilineans]|uniref:M61 family metallopeptidase n=1 Tax=Xanthomonas albilineans TaxID=29447 RepID=UPI0005F30070|nr:tetratricopeptide repeat protein [Xanthomonas albilineans]